MTNKQYKAPIGTTAEGAAFKDIWTDENIKHEWHRSQSQSATPLRRVQFDERHGNTGGARGGHSRSAAI